MNKEGSAPKEFEGNTSRKPEDLCAWLAGYSEPVLEPDLPIVDSHIHVWDDERGRYLIHELGDDVNTGHNIVASVYVEIGSRSMYRAEGPQAEQPIGEVEFANGVAAMSASGRYGKARHCAAIVGYADLMLGEQVGPVLDRLIEAGNGRLRGVRPSIKWDVANAKVAPNQVRHKLLDAKFRRGFACLEPAGLSFDAWLFYPQIPELKDLLHSFSQTSVILNHCGGLWGVPPHHGNRDEVFKVWRSNIRDLAQFPNLSVKVGGLGMPRCGFDFHLRDVPPSSAELAAAWRPYVESCIEIFGVERCMLESNFPPDKQSCSYVVLWNAFKRITQDLSAAEKKSLYHDTAARIYRLPA